MYVLMYLGWFAKANITTAVAHAHAHKNIESMYVNFGALLIL